jgi:hypothetical protein
MREGVDWKQLEGTRTTRHGGTDSPNIPNTSDNEVTADGNGFNDPPSLHFIHRLLYFLMP